MKPRIIPMHDEVIEAVKKRIKLDESKNLVFSTMQGKMLPKNTLYEILTRAKKKAGIKNGNIHSFRHTFTTSLLKKGISIKIVKDLLGHEKIETTERYSHLNPHEFRDMLNFTLKFNL